MAETVAPEMPSAGRDRRVPLAARRGARASTAREYARTGFQGGLQWYRCRHDRAVRRPSCELFAGRTIDVPSMFIAGKSDWGVYQTPGVFERMQGSVCTRMLGCHLVDGAGHWVQQEQPEAVTRLLLDFLQEAKADL